MFIIININNNNNHNHHIGMKALFGPWPSSELLAILPHSMPHSSNFLCPKF
jgi:hypothetical protein